MAAIATYQTPLLQLPSTTETNLKVTKGYSTGSKLRSSTIRACAGALEQAPSTQRPISSVPMYPVSTGDVELKRRAAPEGSSEKRNGTWKCLAQGLACSKHSINQGD